MVFLLDITILTGTAGAEKSHLRYRVEDSIFSQETWFEAKIIDFRVIKTQIKFQCFEKVYHVPGSVQ